MYYVEQDTGTAWQRVEGGFSFEGTAEIRADELCHATGRPARVVDQQGGPPYLANVTAAVTDRTVLVEVTE